MAYFSLKEYHLTEFTTCHMLSLTITTGVKSDQEHCRGVDTTEKGAEIVQGTETDSRLRLDNDRKNVTTGDNPWS